MAASSGPFEVWLTEKLLSLNPDTDTDVFVSYITGILEEEGSEEEKRESLTDLIDQVVEEGQSSVCDELFKQWEKMGGTNNTGLPDNRAHSDELSDHFANILETQKIETKKQAPKTDAEKARKQAILAQYGHLSSGDEDEDCATAGDQGEDLLDFKNMNVDGVKKTEQEMREKNKVEAEKKREKDKVDREAQKQKEKDRKEGEKKRTQKGEKRR